MSEASSDIRSWLARQPKQIQGYRCGACDHIWDGFSAPILFEDMQAHVREHGACPKCGERKTLIMPASVYARMLAERPDAAAGANPDKGEGEASAK
jgi:hypothetical protein